MVAETGDLHSDLLTRLNDGSALLDLDFLAVDRQLDHLGRLGRRRCLATSGSRRDRGGLQGSRSTSRGQPRTRHRCGSPQRAEHRHSQSTTLVGREGRRLPHRTRFAPARFLPSNHGGDIGIPSREKKFACAMYHLLAGLYGACARAHPAEITKKPTYHVLLVGLKGAGKTWILEKARRHHAYPVPRNLLRRSGTLGAHRTDRWAEWCVCRAARLTQSST